MAFNAGEVQVILGGKFNPAGFVAFSSATDKAAADMRKAEASVTASHGRMSKASAALGTAAKTGAAAGILAIGAAAYKSVSLAADFEQQMSSLKSVTGASGKQMQVFQKQAMDAGKATKYSALEAAQAQTELAKGGIKVADMGGALKGALGLAAAGQLDLATAASTTANALNLFGLNGSQATHVADGLATAANATTADVSDFAAALVQGGSAAKAAGLNFDETVVALEALAATGVKGSDAGTSLKTTLAQIANPTDKAATTMKRLGIEFFNAQGSLKPLPAIADNLRDSLGGLTEKQRLAAVQTIAGTDGFRTLLALYDQGPGKLRSFAAGVAEQGTAAQVAAEKQDNLKGKIENLQGSIETLGIELGTKLIPYLSDATDAATDFVNGLSDGTGAGGDFVDTLKNINDAASPISSGIGDIAGAIKSFRDGIDQVGDVSNPFSGLVDGLGQLPTVLGSMAGIVSGIVKTISGILRGDLGGAFDGLKQIVTSAATGVIAAARMMVAPVIGVGRAIGNALEAPIETAVDKILGLFSSMLSGGASAIGALAKIPGVGGQFKGLANGIQSAADSIDGLRESIRSVKAPPPVVFRAEAGPAMAALRKLDGTKIGDKVARVLGNDTDARTKFNALKALGIPAKTARVLAAVGDALAGVSSVQGALAQLRDRTVTLTTNIVKNTKVYTSIESKRGHASGRGADGAEVALVGEGRGPEAIVNPDAMTMTVVDSPQVMALGASDYVIPYEAAYRGRALGLMATLAADMGIAGYKKGKVPAKKKSTANTRPHPAPLQPTHLPVEALEKGRDTAKSALDAAKRDVERLPKLIDTSVGSVSDVKGRKVKTAEQKANKARDLAAAQKKLADRRKQLREAKAEERKQRAIFKAQDRQLVQARAYQKEIDKQTSLADTAADAMTLADKKDDQTGYDSAKTKRLAALKELGALLKRARTAAGDDTEYGRTLDNQLGKNDLEALDTAAAINEAETPVETDAQKAVREAAERLSDTGLTDAERAALTQNDADVALAALTKDLGDDQAAAGHRVDLLKGFLGAVQSDPARGGAASIASIAGQLRTASDNFASLTGTGVNDNPDLQAQLDQAKAQRDAATSEARVNAQALAVFSGPGDIGTGGYASALQAGAGITVNVNALHPGDSSTLAALADATVDGFSRQMPLTTPRVRLG